MKVALLLTGFLRNGAESLSALKSFYLNKYDCSLLLATWDVRTANKKNEIDNEKVDEKLLKNIYGDYLSDFCILDYKGYEKTKIPFQRLNRNNDVFDVDWRCRQHGPYYAQRIRDLWWLVKKGRDLILDYEAANDIKFDMIIRSRFDFHPISMPDLINDNNVYVPMCTDIDINDFFAYGNRENMLYYLNLYENLDIMYPKDNLDVTYGEHVLYWHLRKYRDISLERTNFVYTWGSNQPIP